MELTSPRVNTLKINTKKGYILVDPDTSEEAKVIILNDGFESDIQQTRENLVIYGPGDFEASGILIKGSRSESTIYSIDSGEGRILLATSDSASKINDEDDYNAVILKLNAPVDEATLDALSSRLVVVYGDPSFVPESLKAKSVSKLNFKKLDGLESNVVYLDKK